jgi:tetratricopeptide (TPR) repeat protein
MSTAQLVAIAAVVLPALAFALWPLLRRRPEDAAVAGPTAADRRLELGEEKVAVYRALQELAFEHEAGHLSDDDYAAMRERYELRAAELLAELDALPPPSSAPARPDVPTAAAAPARGWTRHPVTLVAGGAGLVLFGVVLGVNAGRFSEPEPPRETAAMGMPGMGAADAGEAGGVAAPGVPSPGGAPSGTPLPPEVLAGMLRAARQSLQDGRYQEAIAAYQAVLKRDPKNVDAMTHLGLIVAIGGHGDSALETFDRALAIDPKYAPAYLYRGQVLYEVKADYPAAVKAWERYLALVPDGEEHDRVAALVKDARAKPAERR